MSRKRYRTMDEKKGINLDLKDTDPPAQYSYLYQQILPATVGSHYTLLNPCIRAALLPSVLLEYFGSDCLASLFPEPNLWPQVFTRFPVEKRESLEKDIQHRFQIREIKDLHVLIFLNDPFYRHYAEKDILPFWFAFWKNTKTQPKLRMEFCFLVVQARQSSLALLKMLSWSLIFKDMETCKAFLTLNEEPSSVNPSDRLEEFFSAVWSSDGSIYPFPFGIFHPLGSKGLEHEKKSYLPNYCNFRCGICKCLVDGKFNEIQSCARLILDIGQGYMLTSSRQILEKLAGHLADTSFAEERNSWLKLTKEVDNKLSVWLASLSLTKPKNHLSLLSVEESNKINE